MKNNAFHVFCIAMWVHSGVHHMNALEKAYRGQPVLCEIELLTCIHKCNVTEALLGTCKLMLNYDFSWFLSCQFLKSLGIPNTYITCYITARYVICVPNISQLSLYITVNILILANQRLYWRTLVHARQIGSQKPQSELGAPPPLRDRSMEMCPGGVPDSDFRPGKKRRPPPKLRGKKRRPPP